MTAALLIADKTEIARTVDIRGITLHIFRDRTQCRRTAALHVRRTATVNKALRNLSRERRSVPVAVHCGNNIDMTHKKKGVTVMRIEVAVPLTLVDDIVSDTQRRQNFGNILNDVRCVPRRIFAPYLYKFGADLGGIHIS